MAKKKCQAVRCVLTWPSAPTGWMRARNHERAGGGAGPLSLRGRVCRRLALLPCRPRARSSISSPATSCSASWTGTTSSSGAGSRRCTASSGWRRRSRRCPRCSPNLSRDRLKELCHALGLGDAGKEKAVIVARLAGVEEEAEAAPAEPAPLAERPGRGRSGGAKVVGKAEPIEIAAGAKLTIDALERYLWSAADILRGSIDSSDYKGFITNK
jgi:hypothetical protein